MKKYQHLISLQGIENVFIRAHATLDVQGWEKPEISIETDTNVQSIRREKKGFFFYLLTIVC